MTYRKLFVSPRLARRRTGIATLALAAALSLAGCGQRSEFASLDAAPPPAAMPAAASHAGGMAMKERTRSAPQAEEAATGAGQAQEAPLQRYLAVRQDLNVEVPPEQLADAWGKAVSYTHLTLPTILRV